MSIETGGPAFPREDYQSNGYEKGFEKLGQEGMSLRDYFASNSPVTFNDVKKVYGDENPEMNDDLVRKVILGVWSMMNYEYADSMLAERNKK